MIDAALREEIARFDPALLIEEASAPPASWYTDPDVFALERSAVFGRSWIVAARSEQVEGPGSYATGETAGERFVVARDLAGTLHAFANVCRHRASAVARGCGSAERLVCPFHGWTFGLDGKLIAAPDLGGVRRFVKEESGLLPMAVHEWGPLIFVSRSERPRRLDEDLATLEARLSGSGFRRARFVTRRSWDLACNWKVFVDNYLDGGDHVPHLPRGLAAQLDLDSYRTEVFDRFSIQSTAGSKGGAGSGGRDFAERIGSGAIYAWIYPNLMINRYGPIMDTNWVLPIGPDRCRVLMDYYFESTEGAEAGDFIDRSLQASDEVQREDVEICEAVQVGLASESFVPGRYSVKRQAGELHFHRLLAADLRAAAGL